MAVPQKYFFAGLFAVLTVGIVITAVYFTVPDQAGDSSKPQYSFERPGQLQQADEAKPNPYAGLTPEQLAQKANDIIGKADQLIADNPIAPEPLSEEQQQALDAKIAALEQQIKTLEADLKQNGDGQ